MNPFAGFLSQHPSYAWIFPELLLLGGGVLVLCLDLLGGGGRKSLSAWAAVAVLAAALCASIWPVRPDRELVSLLLKNLVEMDGFALFFKAVIVAGALLTVLLSMDREQAKGFQGEYNALILFATAALLFLTGARDLLMAYINLEFFGVCSFALIAWRRGDDRSQEGALKTLLIGAFSSAFLVYGFSLLYGVAGTFSMPAIGQAIQKAPDPRLLSVILTFVLVGLGFKIAAAPFHMWAPEAYQGAPTPIAAFLATAGKAAGLALTVRMFAVCFLFVSEDWPALIGALAIVSMTLGNLTAIWQTSVKRMLAYSSVAHMGYALIGLVTVGAAGLGESNELGLQGLRAIMIYSAVYLFMTLGAFAVTDIVAGDAGDARVSDFAGLGKKAPALAVAMAIFLLSLAGIPPTAGFVGKFFLFKAAIDAASKHPILIWLAVAAAANSVASLYYYWNIVRQMYLETGNEEAVSRGAFSRGVAAFALALTLALGLFFAPLLQMADQAHFLTGLP